MKVQYAFILFALALPKLSQAGAMGLSSLKKKNDTKVEPDSRPEITDKYVDVMNADSHPLGVKADCSAQEVSAQELEDIAKNADSAIDFLKKIPQDSFQNFTLVTNSKSAQRCEGEGKVNPMWPRVLRSSADGKMTFSYTCNPESCAYNKVEVIYYDDNGKQLNTMSLDFNQKDKSKKVHHNDQSCLNCHGSDPSDPSSFKHIWPQYFQWAGCEGSDTINMYGSNDDSMNPEDFRDPGSGGPEYRQSCDSEKIQAANKTEAENFKAFKEMHLGEGENNNPCYALLPWAKPTGEEGGQYDPEKHANYPYFSKRNDIANDGNEDGFENLYLRPNQRFTQTYARINAARIAGKIEKTRNYERIKFFLGLEAAGCLEKSDEDKINELIPSLNFKFRERNIGGNGTKPYQTTPLLYDYALASGLSDADWTLEYQGKDPTYNAAIPRTSLRHQPGGGAGSDTSIAEVASAKIVESLALEYPQIANESEHAMTTGAADAFGPQWACLDKVGATVKMGHQGPKRPLCTSIRAELEEYLKTAINDPCGASEALTVSEKSEDLVDSAFSIERKFDENSAKRGKKLVQNRCMKCHSASGEEFYMAPDSFYFFSSDSDSPEAKDEALAKMKSSLKNYEAALRSGRMPADGPRLTDQDIDDVLMYIDSNQ